ncbi:hypothetical protein HY224_02990 [Candidatus Uhrbacteria bacterium]|nr:hypothetical protein [Candidatus Uhrbacteria bacterium]
MDINHVLQGLGMHENKIKTYLACLELSAATASQIASQAQLQRTTVYEILKDLQSEGLISSTPKGHGTMFTAEPPEQLKAMLKEKEKQVEKILPDLKSRFNVSIAKPRVRFYEGVTGVRAVYADTLTSRSKILRALLSIADIYEFVGKDWFHQYTAQRIALGAKLLVIRPESREVAGVFPSSTKDNREVRYPPKGTEFALTQYVYDNKVALISTAQEGYGMIIESEEYFKMQLNLFNTLWDVSRITKKVD